MDKSEFEKLISNLESKLKRAVLRVGLKKIEVQVFLLFPLGESQLGTIHVEAYRRTDILNRKKPQPIYKIKSDCFKDIERGFLKWVIDYKSTIDKVAIK